MILNPYILLAGAVVSFGAGFELERRLKNGEIAEQRAAWSQQTTAGLEASARKTADLQTAADAARKALYAKRQEIAARDADNARLLTANGGLRKRLADFAAGSADDSVATCRSRSRKLADLLAEGAGLVAEGDQLVAERNSEIDALLESWPTN